MSDTRREEERERKEVETHLHRMERLYYFLSPLCPQYKCNFEGVINISLALQGLLPQLTVAVPAETPD